MSALEAAEVAIRLLGLLLVQQQQQQLEDLLQAPTLGKGTALALHCLVLGMLSLVRMHPPSHITIEYVQASACTVASAAKLAVAVAELAPAQQAAASRALRSKLKWTLSSILTAAVQSALLAATPEELERSAATPIIVRCVIG